MKQTPKIITIVTGNQIISNSNALSAIEVHEIIINKLTKEVVYDGTFQAPTVHIVDSSDFPIGQYEVIYQYGEVVQTDNISVVPSNLNENKILSDPPIGLGIVSLVQGRSHQSTFTDGIGMEIYQEITNEQTSEVCKSDTFTVSTSPFVKEFDLSNCAAGTYIVIYLDAVEDTILTAYGDTRFDLT